MIRVAFFFVGGDRSGMLETVRRGEVPDSILRGANFFAQEPDVEVALVSSGRLERRVPRAVRALLPMSLVQLLYIPRLMRYDVVISSDGILLGHAVASLSWLLGRRTRWIFVAINSSVLMKRHAGHPLRRRLLRHAWNSYAAIVCLAERQREDFIRSGIHEHLLTEIRLGVDTHFFTGVPRAEGSYILSVGKDIGRDYGTLLEAAREVDHPILIIASPKNIPHGADIPSNVTIRYNIALVELREVYAKARLLVVASLPEGTGLGADCSGQTVVLEALAAGRAVIATKRAWLTEYLVEGREYKGVPPGDSHTLARTMNDLWDDSTLCTGLARAGQARVAAEYSSCRFAEGLLTLTRSVVFHRAERYSNPHA